MIRERRGKLAFVLSLSTVHLFLDCDRMWKVLRLLLTTCQTMRKSSKIEEHQWLCSKTFKKQSNVPSSCFTYKTHYFLLSLFLFSRFEHILKPIAEIIISKEQRGFVDFESFFTHTICHECCHGIGPHSITLPDGRTSSVRKVLLPFLKNLMY